jgi:hypothetical protein
MWRQSHAYEMDRAYGRDANAVGERLREEPPILRPGHFAGGESEFGMSNAAAPADRALAAVDALDRALMSANCQRRSKNRRQWSGA